MLMNLVERNIMLPLRLCKKMYLKFLQLFKILNLSKDNLHIATKSPVQDNL